MGGHSSQGDSEVQPLGSLSFVPALLGSAFFGTGIGTEGGGFQILGPNDVNPHDDITSNFEAGFGSVITPPGQQSLLDPTGLVSNLLDLTNPGANPGTGVAGLLQSLGGIGGVQGSALLQGPATATFREGLETGFLPDIQPVIDQATRGFFEGIVPELGQRNVALQEGTGPFSTDLNDALLKAGAGIATNLGALQTQLQNDAGQRRAELSALAGTFAGNLSRVPQEAAGRALDLGEQQILTGTAGGRQAQLLQLLAGLQPGGTGVRGTEQSQSGKGGGVLSG